MRGSTQPLPSMRDVRRYRDLRHYYDDASSARLLHNVAVPLLLVDADDDVITGMDDARAVCNAGRTWRLVDISRIGACLAVDGGCLPSSRDRVYLTAVERGTSCSGSGSGCGRVPPGVSATRRRWGTGTTEHAFCAGGPLARQYMTGRMRMPDHRCQSPLLLPMAFGQSPRALGFELGAPRALPSGATGRGCGWNGQEASEVGPLPLGRMCSKGDARQRTEWTNA